MNAATERRTNAVFVACARSQAFGRREQQLTCESHASEDLTYYFPIVDGRDATLRFHWGTVIVPLAIKVQ